MSKVYTTHDIPKLGYGTLTWIGAIGFSMFVIMTTITTAWIAINVQHVMRNNATSLKNQDVSMRRLEGLIRDLERNTYDTNQTLKHSLMILENQKEFAPQLHLLLQTVTTNQQNGMTILNRLDEAEHIRSQILERQTQMLERQQTLLQQQGLAIQQNADILQQLTKKVQRQPEK